MADNRIAFGLCKQHNIKLPEGDTPHDTWEALKKCGIVAGDNSPKSGSIKPGEGEPPTEAQLEVEFDINSLTAEIEVNPQNASQILKHAIDSGKVNLRIHKGHQDKHIQGTQNYRQELENGREPSILTADPESLISTYAGNGVPIFRKGKWMQAEAFAANEPIGIYKNKQWKQSFSTKYGRIHYSNKGAHVVPDRKKYGKN